MTESITPSGGTIHVLQSKPWLITVKRWDKPRLAEQAVAKKGKFNRKIAQIKSTKY